MTRNLRPMIVAACITAATAFGAQLAAADTGMAPKGAEAKCGEQASHNGHHKGRHHRGQFPKRMAKELGMNDQQQAQAKAILEKSKAENKPLVTSLMTERRQMRTLIMSGSADERAVRAQAAKVASVQADLAVKRSQEARQLLALLTPDQVTKLRAIMDKREQKFRDHRHEEQGMM